jgi:hypothetical protein
MSGDVGYPANEKITLLPLAPIATVPVELARGEGGRGAYAVRGREYYFLTGFVTVG